MKKPFSELTSYVRIQNFSDLITSTQNLINLPSSAWLSSSFAGVCCAGRGSRGSAPSVF